MYDIILQNNSSKEVFLLSGQTPDYETEYYLSFENFSMPEGAKSGEYTYAIIRNDLSDVKYTFQAVITDTLIDVNGNIYTLDTLNPFIGLVRIDMGEEQPTPIFDKTDTENNNTVYYYEG